MTGGILRSLKSTRSLLVQLTEVVAGMVLGAMVVVVFVGVIDRFLLHVGLPWPEELARYLLIWLSMLSAALAVTKAGHYVVDYFYKRLLGPLGRTLIGEVFAAALSLLTAVVILIHASALMQRVSWQRAPALDISMSWVYLALPVSLGLIAFFYLVEMADAVHRAGRGEGSPARRQHQG